MDLEDLARKGEDMLRKEYIKPLLTDVVRLGPLVNDLITAIKAKCGPLTEGEYNMIKRGYKYPGKKSFLFQVYLMGTWGEIDGDMDQWIRLTFQIKAVKSWSGVCNITIFTTPFPAGQSFTCPFNCSYCPNEPGMPRSYLTLEPATLRAKKNDFDCVRQMHDRMNTLFITGHGNMSKLEVNVLGGTFSCYPDAYRKEFIRDIYYAANVWLGYSTSDDRARLSLEEEKTINDFDSRCKIVQVVIETRPDSLTEQELKFLRYLSVTRIQIGIQHTDDDVLNKNNRRCPHKKTIEAIEAAKRIGMKIDGHFMPNLPGTTVEKDRNMLVDELTGTKFPVPHRYIEDGMHWEVYDLSHPEIQVDQMKIYPTAVTPYTDIEKWYREGSYVPYPEEELRNILLEFKPLVFPWIRLNRIMRDFYADNIISETGSNLNMRNDLKNILAIEGKVCRCIRCREAKLNKLDHENYLIVVREYNASNGTEFFISAESPDQLVLYGFVRLRLDDARCKIFPELNGAAMIREAHVYSTMTDIGKKGNIQHRGLGTLLMSKAESIAIKRGYRKIAVIAAVGSRGFYRKLGYDLSMCSGEYMFRVLY